MPKTDDLFDMRRLEALSNTIFGVAMTLFAYRVPTAQFLNGAPVWSTICRLPYAIRRPSAQLRRGGDVLVQSSAPVGLRAARDPVSCLPQPALSLVGHRTTHHERPLRHVRGRTRCCRAVFRPFGGDERVERHPVASRKSATRPIGQGRRVDLRDRHLYRGDLGCIGCTNGHSEIHIVRCLRGVDHRGNKDKARTRLAEMVRYMG